MIGDPCSVVDSSIIHSFSVLAPVFQFHCYLKFIALVEYMGFGTEISDAGSSYIRNTENLQHTAHYAITTRMVICLTQSHNHHTLRSVSRDYSRTLMITLSHPTPLSLREILTCKDLHHVYLRYPMVNTSLGTFHILTKQRWSVKLIDWWMTWHTDNLWFE